MTFKQIYRQIEPIFRPTFDQGLIVGSGAQKAIELDVDLQYIYYDGYMRQSLLGEDPPHPADI